MKIQLVVLYVLAIGALATGIFALTQKPKVAYVDNNQLFQDFELTKELNGKFETTRDQRQYILDSLEVRLKHLMNSLQQKEYKTKMEEFQIMREDYLQKKNRFEEDNANQTRQYNEQIWKQLNTYIQDFGKEKGYRYIHGTSGTGNLMYATDEDDITKDLLKYANDRYSK